MFKKLKANSEKGEEESKGDLRVLNGVFNNSQIVVDIASKGF